MDQSVKKKIKGIPDIVICLDLTASMSGCVEQLKTNLGDFIASLETPQEVQAGVVGQVTDWRIRLFAFRDLKHPSVSVPPEFSFCSSAPEFRSHLTDPRCATENSVDEPESSLDAVYLAIRKSAWRPSDEAHRFVILFTDAPPHPRLQPGTVNGGPDDVQEVVQALKAQRVKLILFAPRAPEFEELYGAMQTTHPELAEAFPLFKSREDALAFFTIDSESARERFANVLVSLAKTISVASSDEL